MKNRGFRNRRSPFRWALAGLVLSSLFFAASCSPKEDEPREQEQTLLQELQALPGFQVTQIQALQGFAQSFQIDFMQPVDHAAPATIALLPPGALTWFSGRR